MTELLWREELRLLQQQVAALQGTAAQRHRVTVTPVQPQPWLGQAVTLGVRVTDEGATQPRVDLPVVVMTTWGRLRAADGYGVQAGESIVVRTDLRGEVTLTLLPPLREQLWEPQQRALEALLAQFDPTATAPTALLPMLNNAVAQYQQATAQDLRAAVDAYFAHFYQPRLTALSAYDWLQSWQTITATVTVLALEAATSAAIPNEKGAVLPTTVQGAAVLPLRFKDWIGPWLQRYIDLVSEQGRLRQQFTLLKTLTQNPEELAGATAELVQALVHNQLGHTGEELAQQVVYGVVTTLLDRDMQELPVATRVKLLTSLPAATATVRTLGSRASASVGQAATNLKADFTQDLTTVTTTLQTVDRNFALFQAETTAQLQGTLARDEFVRFQGELDQQVAKLSDRTDAMQVQFGKLQNQVGRFDSSLSKLQLDLRDVQEEIKRRPGLQVIQELQATLATLSTTLTTLNSDVSTFRDQVNVRLTDTVTRTELTQVRTDLGQLVATKLDQQQLDQAFGDLDVRLRNVQTDVGVFRSNVTRLRGDLDALGTNVSKLRIDVDKLRPRP